jgi:Tfp pilus assembly protein PilV
MIDQNPDTSYAQPNDKKSRSSGSALEPGGRLRRLVLYAVVLLGVFLLGLVPMWVKAHERAQELNRAQATLRISALQNLLANAASDARRGDYESARQAVSHFFTNLQTEMDRGADSAFTPTQQNDLHSMFVARDETITQLARSDPAAVERLFDLYNTYRQTAAGEAKQRAA